MTKNGTATENIDEDGTNEDGTKEGGDTGTSTSANTEKTFTQTEVTQMMTKEKSQGRAAAYRALGLDPSDEKAIEDAKKLLGDDGDDSTDAGNKNIDTVDADGKTDTSELEEKFITLEQRVMMAEAKAEAMASGVNAQYVDDVVTLAMSKISKDDDFSNVLNGLKAKYPNFFAASSEETGKKGTGSSVSGSKPGSDKGAGSGLGARLAAQRTTAPKQSFWGK